MPNRNYIAGRAREYRTCELLKKAGWAVVRSAGSHGLWDVHAVKYGPCCPFRYIQVKRTKDTWRVPKAEISEFLAWEAPPGARKELWVYRDRAGLKVFWLPTMAILNPAGGEMVSL